MEPAPDPLAGAIHWRARLLWSLGAAASFHLAYEVPGLSLLSTVNLIRRGASLIIVPTMDVESWGEHEHRLHARVAPTRAAEYGVPIFRLCSSGISQAVNAGGRVQASAPFPGRGETLAATFNLRGPGALPPDRLLACLSGGGSRTADGVASESSDYLLPADAENRRAASRE